MDKSKKKITFHAEMLKNYTTDNMCRFSRCGDGDVSNHKHDKMSTRDTLKS